MQLKKIVSISALLVLGTSLTACGGGGGSSDSGDTPTPSPTPTPAVVTAGLMVTTEKAVPSPVKLNAGQLSSVQRLTAINNLTQEIKLSAAVSSEPITIESIDKPAGIDMTQIQSGDACQVGQSLALQQSCSLSYEIKPNKEAKDIDANVVIHTNSQTTPTIEVPIKLQTKDATESNFPKINIVGANSQSKLTIGSHYTIQIKNDSQKTMDNLRLELADWLLPHVSHLVATTSTGNLVAGQSAILSFDINDDAAALAAIKAHETAMLSNAVNGEVLKVTAVNALDTYPNIVPVINPLNVSKNQVSFTVPTIDADYKNVMLSNSSNQSLLIKSLELSQVKGVSIVDTSCKAGLTLPPGGHCTLSLKASDLAVLESTSLGKLNINYQLANSSLNLVQQLDIDVAKTMINSDDIIDIAEHEKAQAHSISIENKGNFTWYPSSDIAQYHIAATADDQSVHVLTTGEDNCLSLGEQGVLPNTSCTLYFQGGETSLLATPYHINVTSAGSNLVADTDLGAFEYTQSVLAANVVQSLPETIIKGHDAYIKLALTNISDAPQTYQRLLFLTGYGSGSYVNDFSGDEKGCVTTDLGELAPNETCYYKVMIDYPTALAATTDQVTIKSSGSHYNIDKKIAVTLADAATQTDNLAQIDDTSPVLTPGHTTYIEVKNTSAVIANGLQLVIPAWADGMIDQEHSDLTMANNLLPGESHIFHFKIKDTAEAMSALQAHQGDIQNNGDTESVSAADAFILAGGNINERINLSADIEPIALSKNEVSLAKSYKAGETPSGMVAIQLNNLKDQTSSYQFDMSKLPHGVTIGGTCDLSSPDTIQVPGNGSCELELMASKEAYNQSTNEGLVITDPVTHVSDTLKISIPKTQITQTNEDYVYQRGEQAYVFVKNTGEFNWHVSNDSADYGFLGSDVSGLSLADMQSGGEHDCRLLSQDFDGVAPGESCSFPVNIDAQTALGNYELAIKSSAHLNLSQAYNQGFSVIKNTGALAMQDVDGVNQLYGDQTPLELVNNGEAKSIYLKNVGVDSVHNITVNSHNLDFIVANNSCHDLSPHQSCQITLKTADGVGADVTGDLSIQAQDADPGSIIAHLKSVQQKVKRWVWLSDLKGSTNLFSWKKNGEYICDQSMTVQECANTICGVDPNRPQGENMLTYQPYTGDYRAWISSDSRTEPSFNARDNVGLSDMTMGKEYYSLTNDGKLFSTSHDILLGNNLENPLTTQINDNEAWTTSKANGEITTQPYKVSYWNNTGNVYYGQWVTDKYKSVEPDRIKVFWEIGTRTSKTDWIWRYGSTVKTDGRWSNDNSASSETRWTITGSGYNYALPPTKLRHLICFER
ncbi:hypothetical protein [Cysteiniphilum litorale]|uniref:hypothetical protein n=1 Tax=Cysteiniphilum litorale TaxID=2056700 RepID=UPI003F884671